MMRAVALLAVGLALVEACFFWEQSECAETEQMCGQTAIIEKETENNRCNKFIYFINHANEECAPSDATNVTLDEYRDCFWDEVSTHVEERGQCGGVCNDAWPESKDEKKKFICYEQCVHVHTCLRQCDNKKYKYRDTIRDCLEECGKDSPVANRDTCKGRCSGHSANRKCWCDPTCVYVNDCCPDYDNQCQAKGSARLSPPNETFALPGLNVTQHALDVKGHQAKKRQVTPAEIGINETEHPLVDAPNASFNGSRLSGKNKTKPAPESEEDIQAEEEAEAQSVEALLNSSATADNSTATTVPPTTTTTTVAPVDDDEDAPTTSLDPELSLLAAQPRNGPSRSEGRRVLLAGQPAAAVAATADTPLRAVRLRGPDPASSSRTGR